MKLYLLGTHSRSFFTCMRQRITYIDRVKNGSIAYKFCKLNNSKTESLKFFNDTGLIGVGDGVPVGGDV